MSIPTDNAFDATSVRVLVAGASGYLGRFVALAFARHGYLLPPLVPGSLLADSIGDDSVAMKPVEMA